MRVFLCVGVCEGVQVCVYVCVCVRERESVSVIPRPCAGAVAPSLLG